MKKMIALAVAGVAGTAVAQPTIEILTSAPEVVSGDSFTVTVAIGGVNFDPFAALTGLPAPAPTAYQIDVNFSGGGAVVNDAAADQVRNIDVDGLFGPQPPASFFTSAVLSDLSIQGSNAALVFGALDPNGGLFDDGALFTFTFQTAADFVGDIQISIGAPSGDGSFSQDVLDYGTDGNVPGSTAGGPGAASLGTAVVRVTPTPGAAAIVGLGGLVAARRRR
ncbi:MAG: hypothetical protein AAGI17_06335 [Planctomycetota bacterium]